MTSEQYQKEHNVKAEARLNETDEHRYLRETRTATVFIAWVVAILCILGLIGVIVTGVQLSKLTNPDTNPVSCIDLGTC